MESYIPAIITLIGTILSALISAGIALTTSRRANDKTMAVMQERIRILTEEVHKHNQLIERTYKLEGAIDNIRSRLDKER